MANGVRYHPSSRQRMPFERRSLWPQEEDERIPGSTFNEFLGSGSPINYEALGLPMDRRQREEEQFISSMWGDPATSDYDIQVVRREDLGLPPLGSRQPSLMPPMDAEFKSKISMPSKRGVDAKTLELDDIRSTQEAPIDLLYESVKYGEHRNLLGRIDPWVDAGGSTGWGPVQMLGPHVADMLNQDTYAGKNMIPLTAEERKYAKEYVKGKRPDTKRIRELYKSIALKSIYLHWNVAQGDPKKFAELWRWGLYDKRDPNNIVVWADGDNVTKDIAVDDPDYWREFMRRFNP